MCLRTWAHSKDSDQTARPRGLIRVFTGCFLDRQGFGVSSAGSENSDQIMLTHVRLCQHLKRKKKKKLGGTRTYYMQSSRDENEARIGEGGFFEVLKFEQNLINSDIKVTL